MLPSPPPFHPHRPSPQQSILLILKVFLLVPSPPSLARLPPLQQLPRHQRRSSQPAKEGQCRLLVAGRPLLLPVLATSITRSPAFLFPLPVPSAFCSPCFALYLAGLGGSSSNLTVRPLNALPCLAATAATAADAAALAAAVASAECDFRGGS